MWQHYMPMQFLWFNPRILKWLVDLLFCCLFWVSSTQLSDRCFILVQIYLSKDHWTEIIVYVVLIPPDRYVWHYFDVVMNMFGSWEFLAMGWIKTLYQILDFQAKSMSVSQMSKSDPDSDGERLFSSDYEYVIFDLLFLNNLSIGTLLVMMWRGCKCFGWWKYMP